ncbi:MAG: sulfur carrier protein ThiS [Myxococcota bacterium]
MKLTVNGETMAVPGVRTVADLLDKLDLGPGAGARVAVAVNTQVVPRTEHARQRLAAGDRVEIIHAVGGG